MPINNRQPLLSPYSTQELMISTLRIPAPSSRNLNLSSTLTHTPISTSKSLTPKITDLKFLRKESSPSIPLKISASPSTFRQFVLSTQKIPSISEFQESLTMEHCFPPTTPILSTVINIFRSEPNWIQPTHGD